jgi:hypothetical protein
VTLFRARRGGDAYHFPMNLNLSDPVLAAMIGAGATTITALIQLRLSWRKELRERERGQPITKKSRRGPVLLVFALMVAAAVGGFSGSQYLMAWRNGDRDALREEMRAKLAEIHSDVRTVVRAGDCGKVPAVPALMDVQLFPEEGVRSQ